MGWDPIGDLSDAGDWLGDTADDIWEGITGEEAAKVQAALAKSVAAKNAEMVFEAGTYERLSLQSQGERDRRIMEVNYLQDVQALRTDIDNATDRTTIAATMEEVEFDAEMARYRGDYTAMVDKATAARAIARRGADATLEGQWADINLAYDITTRKAEFDLNREILASELLAKQDIEQAGLTRSITEGKAGTLREVQQMAAMISAAYRTDTELAESVYTMKRTVAAVQARSGASGFTGESINIVAEDTRNFFQGQVDALQSNIAAELKLSIYNSNANYRDTVSAARETEKLTANHALEQLAITTDIAKGAYEVTAGSAEAIKKVGETKALSAWNTDTLNYQDTYRVNNAIAERSLRDGVKSATAIHEGRVDSINLEYDILTEGKRKEAQQLWNNYMEADAYVATTLEREINWSTWKTAAEMDIARLGGRVTATSIMNQQRQAAWQRGAQIAGTAIALA